MKTLNKIFAGFLLLALVLILPVAGKYVEAATSSNTQEYTFKIITSNKSGKCYEEIKKTKDGSLVGLFRASCDNLPKE